MVNAALDRVDEAVAGVTSVAISGAGTVLTSTNYSADQARSAALVFTGTLSANSTVTAPNTEKTYLIVNNTTQGSYSLTLKTAAGTGYALRPGPQHVYCDGTDVYRGSARMDQLPAPTASVDLGGQKITGLGTPTLSTDAVTKAYADLVGAGADTAATINSIAKRDSTARLAASVFLSGDGSASAPAQSFTSDTDTGLARTAANTLGFVTGGAVRASIDGSGVMRQTGNMIWETGTNRNVGYQALVQHNAGNVGTTTFGVDDGGGFTGLAVVNAASGGLNSQRLELKTAEGGVSTSTTRTTITANGYLRHGQNSTDTPGFGNTTTGSAIFPDGRLFLSGPTFSSWNLNADGILVSLARSGTAVGSIDVSTIGASFNTSSDYRLKENVAPLTGAVTRLAALKPSRFNFKVLPDKTFDGFLAHEVSPVVPEAVTGEKDGPRMQSIDQSKLVPLLVAAVQELAARVEALEGNV